MQANKTESPRTAKAQAILKAQITSELKNKKQCTYHPYECTQFALDKYEYCQRHILCDKTAPFKPCSYVYGSGKRCCYPAFKFNKKEASYCNEHALKAHLARAKQGVQMKPPRTAETLLSSLSHYVKKPKDRTLSINSSKSDDMSLDVEGDELDSKTTKALDPFVDIDASLINASCSDVLDLCSESESDIETTTFSNVWQDAHADSSEDESIDSEHEDLLKHADVLSAEEVTLVAKEKLVRLQSLYMDQYYHLYHLMREKRRRYLHALKREKETCCSISNQPHETPQEQRMYKKLKAYNQYHKKFGTDAILRKRSNELRMKITDGALHKPIHFLSKCTFSEGGVKCIERALPVARHCRKHILKDPNQVLFRACGTQPSDIECATPVEAIFDEQTCVLHRDIPALRVYSHPRKDSDSDPDDQLDCNKKVKTEIIDYSTSLGLEAEQETPDPDSDMKDESLSADEANFSDVKEGKTLEEKYLIDDANPVIAEINNSVNEESVNLDSAQDSSINIDKEQEIINDTVDIEIATEVEIEIETETVETEIKEDTKDSLEMESDPEVQIQTGSEEIAVAKSASF